MRAYATAPFVVPPLPFVVPPLGGPRTRNRLKAALRTWLAAWACLCFPLAARADEESPRLAAYRDRIDAAIDRGLAFLEKQQVAAGQAGDPRQGDITGSFRGFEPGNTGITSLGVLAFMSKGYTPGTGRYGQIINAGIDFVLGQQEPNGLLYPAQRRANRNGAMYSHSIATLLLAEASGMVDSERQKRIDAALPKALALLLSAQNVHKQPAHAGGWRYTPNSTDSDLSLTGWAIMALRAGRLNGAPVPKENIEAAVQYILRCRRSDGGFAYQAGQASTLGVTGCAALCLELCGEHGNPAVRPAGDYIAAHASDRNTRNMRAYYAYYYCSQATFQLGGHYWETWAPKMYDALLGSQQPNGAWPGADVGETYNTALSILAMTVSYRQLPIYQRDDSPEEPAEKTPK